MDEHADYLMIPNNMIDQKFITLSFNLLNILNDQDFFGSTLNIALYICLHKNINSSFNMAKSLRSKQKKAKRIAKRQKNAKKELAKLEKVVDWLR